MKNTYISLLVLFLLSSCNDYKDEYRYENDADPFENTYIVDWEAAADSSVTSLIEHFWDKERNYFHLYQDTPGVSNSWHYWPQAHAMDLIIDAYIRTGDSKYSDLFDKWYVGIYGPNGNTYYNHFYDDMEWIALTMVRLYKVTNNEKYLQTAKELWVDIQGGWNDLYGGGISWNKGDGYYDKGVCSNAPACILGVKLYKITEEDKYKESAEKVYHWMRSVLYEPETGFLQEGMGTRFTLSYSLGTFLASGLGMYEITGEEFYLKDAIKATSYGITSNGMVTSLGILRDEGNGDGSLFKGIFIRYFLELIQSGYLSPSIEKQYTDFLNLNAQYLWKKGTDKDIVVFGDAWDTPVTNTIMHAQVSGATLIEARAAYDLQLKR